MKYDITFHPSWWHKYAGVDFTQNFFDDPEYRMECDVRMRRTLFEKFGRYGIGEEDPQKRPLIGTDLLAAGYLYSELFGCGIIYEPDNSPQVVCKHLTEDDIEDVELPDLDKSEVWARTQKQIDYLLKNYGRVETYINLQGIQNIAMDLMGQDVMMAYYSAPEELNGLLQKITDLSIEVGRRFYALSDDISGGVTAIIRQTRPKCYLTSNCSVEMVSNTIYEDFLLEYDRQLAEAFPHFAIHHCGRSMEHVTDGYAKVPNLEFAEVGAFSDIKTVREKLPGVFLNARYSPVRLMNASKEEVEKEVAALAENGNENGGLLSISCVGIDGNMPEENILNFLEACSKISDTYAD